MASASNSSPLFILFFLFYFFYANQRTDNLYHSFLRLPFLNRMKYSRENSCIMLDLTLFPVSLLECVWLFRQRPGRDVGDTLY